MFTFDPTAYAPQVAELLAGERLMPLGAGSPRQSMRPALARLSPRDLVEQGPIQDEPMAQCVLSGLWLLHDFLDESHRISQEISTPTGSYWHGIMHRREPDYSNSKYWFRQASRHPLCDALGTEAAARLDAWEGGAEQPEGAAAARRVVGESGWDPFAMVDLCQEAAGNAALEPACRELARLEWEMLFDYCYRQATGR